jgi:exportin-T
LINEAVLTIIVDGMERMAALRKTTTSSPELSEAIEIVDWGIRTFGSYAGMLILSPESRGVCADNVQRMD